MVTEYSQDPYRDMSVPKFMEHVNAPLFWGVEKISVYN